MWTPLTSVPIRLGSTSKPAARLKPQELKPNLAKDSGYIGEKSYLAQVISYDEGTSLAKCIQKNKFSCADRCEYLTPGCCGKELNLIDMFDEDGNSIDSCPHPQQIFYLKTVEKLKAGDLIRKYL